MLLKKILLYHIIPAAIAALICWGFVNTFKQDSPDLAFSAPSVSKQPYILHFNPYVLTEQAAFSLALKQAVPVLMGSSELTSGHLEALAHNFFNRDTVRDRFLSIGHAGFQSFGILTVLAANRALLKNAKVTIILSPGWFEQQYCKGTSLTSFFEYATPNYLYQILNDTLLDDPTRSHLENYVSTHFDQISKPDATLRLLGRKRSLALAGLANRPFDLLNRMELEIQSEKDLYLISQKLITDALMRADVPSYHFYSRSVNWDSLITISKNKFKEISNNNQLSVENAYYDQWLKNKRKKRLVAVDLDQNQEFKDLEALLHFLRSAECKPLFVIMPLNTKAHDDLSVLKPTIDAIDSLLSKNDFKTLNMFQPNLDSYEDGVLEDIMHPYNVGWYQIDRFILDNFKNE